MRDIHSPDNVYYDPDKNTIELNSTISDGHRKRGDGGNVDIYWDEMRRIRIVAAMSVIGQVLQLFGGDIRNQALNMGYAMMHRLEAEDPPSPQQPELHHILFMDYSQGNLHDPNRQIIGINTIFIGDGPTPALHAIEDFIRENPNLNPVTHPPVDHEGEGAFARGRAPNTHVIPPPDQTMPDLPAPGPQPSATPRPKMMLKERRQQPDVASVVVPRGAAEREKLSGRNLDGRFCDAPIGNPWNLLLGLNPGDVTDSDGFNNC